MMRTRILLLALFVVFLAASVVLAKEEAFLEPVDADWGGFDAAQDARNPMFHTAYYGWVNDDADVDAFVYRLDEDVTNFQVAISVPVCGDAYESFYPTVAIVGEGLETPEDVELPFELPEGMGAMIMSESRAEGLRRTNVYEPYNLYESGINAYQLDAGDYVIAVWDTDAAAGPYVLRTYYLHPEFTDYTTEDWAALEATYDAVNNHGWVGRDCEQITVAAETS